MTAIVPEHNLDDGAPCRLPVVGRTSDPHAGAVPGMGTDLHMPRTRNAFRRAGWRTTDLDDSELHRVPHPFAWLQKVGEGVRPHRDPCRVLEGDRPYVSL